MPATVTLSTTTLAAPVNSRDGRIKVASTSGLFAGYRLWIDKELMSVVSLDVDTWVNVKRGVDGTSGSAHSSSATLTIGRADQFYTSDPVGSPPAAVLVSPWINVLSGKVWFAQGDTLPDGDSNRWWQEESVTRGVGPLGVRTTTLDPTEST